MVAVVHKTVCDIAAVDVVVVLEACECEAAAESGNADNVVVNAPHTAKELAGEWNHPYTREEAAFPLEWIVEGKFFPYVTKIDNGYGDRNLVCRCM